MIGRILSLLSVPLMGLTIWGLIRQVRTEQRLSVLTPVIGTLMAPLTLLINLIFMRDAYVLVLGRTLPALLRLPTRYALRFLFLSRKYTVLLGPAVLVLGLGLGLAWGQTTRLYRKGSAVVGKRSMLHLVFWGLSYALTQVLAAFAPATWLLGGLAAMFFSTGTTLGTNLNLLVRRLWLSRVRPGSP